ncbi:MAPEG family protein [Litorimonas haliclonae]|uniref:MAPEG family protein n=1 Tax=Litorimonas haliclonae TaxID=2081977 RepID=UPI0039EF4BE6
MTLLEIVAFYVALNLILAPILIFRVVRIRLNEKVSLGDGGNALLNARVRAHGNYIETAPLALIGLIALAMLSAPAFLLHLFGVTFLIARLMHAHGMSKKHAIGRGRPIGSILTLLTYLGMALSLLYLIFTSDYI